MRSLITRRASHLLSLQRTTTGRSFVSTGEALPLLRAVKDAEEIERLRAAGSAADAVFAEVLGLGFGGTGRARGGE